MKAAELVTKGGGSPMDAETLLFFAGHEDALPLYEAFERAVLSRFPDARVRVAKTQIAFANRRNFAFVSFLPVRRAAERPKPYITVTFGLGRRETGPRVDVSVEPYPNRWTHHVLVGAPEEIDGELMALIGEAYAFALAKR